MTVRITNTARRLGILALLAALPATALADVCTDQGWGEDPIPQCEVQKQAPVPYNRAETKGWAYYCTGDHPYFWGYASTGRTMSYDWDQSGFTGPENPFFEYQPSKLDATFTNWYGAQDLTVNMACSAVAPPDVAGCTTVGAPILDPGCPQANIHNYCSNAGGVVVCFQTYTETCTNGISYDCNAQFGVGYCSQCQASSAPTLSVRARAEQAAAARR